MNQFINQQHNMEEPQLPSPKKGKAIASLILGVLSIILFFTVILPFPLGILAIILGALSVKGLNKGLAIAGIVTGGMGILLTIIVIAGVIALDRDSQNTMASGADSGTVFRAEEIFHGDNFELRYSSIAWDQGIFRYGNDEGIESLQYIIDGTLLIPSGVSRMLGHSTATASARAELFEEFLSIAVLYGYAEGETYSFIPLRDGIYYASFNIFSEPGGDLRQVLYVIASEQDDIVVSFLAHLQNITRSGPDIAILPVLRTITFTGRSSQNPLEDDYEYRVWLRGNEYEVVDTFIPSLSSIMLDNDIAFRYAGHERTVGSMVLSSILNFLDLEDFEPESVRVEIIEVTYEDVADVWGAIDIFGRLLNDEYDFFVTFSPTEFSARGEDFRFFEVMKELDNGQGIFYVSGIYCRNESVIFMRFGIIETPLRSNGIGPLNLEIIRQAR